MGKWARGEGARDYEFAVPVGFEGADAFGQGWVGGEEGGDAFCEEEVGGFHCFGVLDFSVKSEASDALEGVGEGLGVAG